MAQSSPAGATGDPVACPYLGLADDRPTHFSFPTTDHRCYSGSALKVMSVTHQATLCLTDKYVECRRYVAPVPVQPVPAMTLPSGPDSEAPPMERVAGTVGRAGGSRGGRGPILRVALVLAAVSVLAAAWLMSQGQLSPGSPSGTPSAGPTASIAGPADSPEPATAPPGPSVGPTTPPIPTPSPSPRTHVVTFGQTLWRIANLYGVTVQAIQDANGIKDPNLIVVGQALVIP